MSVWHICKPKLNWVVDRPGGLNFSLSSSSLLNMFRGNLMLCLTCCPGPPNRLLSVMLLLHLMTSPTCSVSSGPTRLLPSNLIQIMPSCIRDALKRGVSTSVDRKLQFNPKLVVGGKLAKFSILGLMCCADLLMMCMCLFCLLVIDP